MGLTRACSRRAGVGAASTRPQRALSTQWGHFTADGIEHEIDTFAIGESLNLLGQRRTGESDGVIRAKVSQLPFQPSRRLR